ncbi:type VI secretion system-associated FHA domain protein [Halopseudomonas maritima]|uniref:type VI secretion system-associated FHA domain protein n=1 Tax=Halopseudomonas maritima TaxID=2918528 RepID=UPI001EEB8FAA|nr:FHA domain-containing protein [Halopseudomonas maritima]UJJ31763.1 FHA domain-containing protein [Halopseudomonas maritima]
MELMLEVISPPPEPQQPPLSRLFRQAGGVIGRAADCDWVLPDRQRIISGHHAQISYSDQAFYLTDTSSNGIHLKADGRRLTKDQPERIEHGQIYCLGELEVRARLQQVSASNHAPIPDDAFLSLDGDSSGADSPDPLAAWLSEPAALVQPTSSAEHHRVEAEHVRLPRAQTTLTTTPAAEGELAEQLCQQLGIQPASSAQAVAISKQAITLLRSAVAELQHSLYAQQQSAGQLQGGSNRHPLTTGQDSAAALQQLLSAADGDELLRSAWRQLRTHQLALQQASNRLTDQLPALLAPAQLLGPALLRTDGARWRALQQQYQQPAALQQRCQQALKDAYQEQHQLLQSLHHNPFG